MKGFLLLAALLTASIAHGQVVRDPVAPNPVRVSTRLQLILTVEHSNVKSGDPVGARTHYKNVSSKTIELGTGYWMLDYAAIVTDTSGAEPPRTSLGERWLQEQREPVLLRSEGPLYVEPGAQGQELAVDLAKIYQLTKPGTYFVRFMFRGVAPDPIEPRPTSVEEARKMPIEEGVSNLVQFTIVP